MNQRPNNYNDQGPNGQGRMEMAEPEAQRINHLCWCC